MNRPYIIKNDILAILNDYARITAEIGLEGEERKLQVDHIDLLACKVIMEEAHVILFSAKQALALRPALQRFVEALDYHLPFPSVFIQFTQPIPEAEFFLPEPSDLAGSTEFLQKLGLSEGDKICGIALNQDQGTKGKVINNAVAWFASTAVNRAAWDNQPDAHLRINPLVLKDEQSQVRVRNKRILQLFAIAIIAYINCENITLERQAVDPKINRKRLKQGKRELPEYYICRVRGEHTNYLSEGAGAGSKHAFRYDVRGHFRRLPDARLTWVRPHQRGLEHEFYKPKVYEVD